MQPLHPGAKDLFLELEGLGAAEQQSRLAACEDPALGDAVRALLEAAGQSDEVFGPEAAPGGREGQRIGAYELVRHLGSGGMGTVWLGERVTDDFHQRVAIKVLAASRRSPEARARFDAERSILAELSHPSIARLYDGGVTDDGAPYLVMEFVEGEPIDEHCAQRGLDVDGRVTLFLQLCDALEHAHARGIVHRDVKPGNVLVTGEGDVKLLDFGIAKWFDADVPGARFRTATGASPLTPAFASPEQLLGSPVSAATDVYSLGVVLYLLVTGELPYDVGGGSPESWVRSICHEPVPPPSARVTAVGSQSTNWHPPPRRLRGDLDTIVLVALRKEPERRYPSARELADDLRRHLDGFPVRARGDSPAYRLRRLLERHRQATRVAAFSLIAIATLGTVAAVLATVNRQQAEDLEGAREGRQSLLAELTGLYELADPWTPGATAGMRPLLDAAVERLRAQDPDGSPRAPEERAALLHAAARVYLRLAEFGAAGELFEEALALRQSLSPPPMEDLHGTLFGLATAVARGVDRSRGEALLREVLALEIERLGPDDPIVGQIRYELATALHGRGDAAEQFREAVRIFRREPAAREEPHASALMSLGEYVAVTGDLDHGIECYEEALALWEELYGQDHPAHAKCAENLALLYFQTDRKREAIDLARPALKVQRRVYGGSSHPEFAWSLLNVGAIRAHGGDAGGLGEIREAVEVFHAQGQDSLARMAATRLADAHVALGDVAGGIAALEDAVELLAEGDPNGPLHRKAEALRARSD